MVRLGAGRGYDWLMKAFGWIGAAVGGLLGGWLGYRAGIFGSFILSTLGSGVGLYLGRRIGDSLIS